MERINMGVIGCGDVAVLQYLPVIRDSKKINLTALCDKNKERLRKVAELFGVKNTFNSHEEMLNSGFVEAVANLTPPVLHYPISIDCLNKKIHTFSEKPIAYDIKEIENIIKTSHDNRVKFACAPSTPLNSALVKVKQLLDDGVIGKPCYAVGSFSHGGPASLGYKVSYYKNLIKQQHLEGFEDLSGDPVAFYKQGGGAIEDLGIYALTSLVFLFGSVNCIQCVSGTVIPEVEVMGGIACGKRIKVEVDDCTLMLLEFNNGPYASLSSSYCVRGTRIPDLEIYGSKGTISMTSYFSEFEVYLEDSSGLAAWNTPYEDLSGWKLGIGVEHIAECIIENKEPVINAELAKHVTEMILKAPQAASSGKKTLIESRI